MRIRIRFRAPQARNVLNLVQMVVLEDVPLVTAWDPSQFVPKILSLLLIAVVIAFTELSTISNGALPLLESTFTYQASKLAYW